MRIGFSRVAIVGAVFLLSGCAGAGFTPHSSIAGPQALQTATVSIRVPVKSPVHAAPKPDYISYATQSVQITVDPGTASQQDTEVDLTVQSGNCVATGILGVLNCTVSFGVLPGAHHADIVTYDRTGGSSGGGSILSATRGYPFTIVASAANTLNFTLYGVPTSVAVFPVNQSAVSGSGSNSTPFSFSGYSSQNFLAVGLDADQNPIIGPGSPTLSESVNNAGAFTITPFASNPNEFSFAPTAAYGALVTFTATPTSGSGASPVAKTVAIVPTLSPVSVGCAVMPFPFPQPNCSTQSGSTVTVTASENGYGGSFSYANGGFPSPYPANPNCTVTPHGSSATVTAVGSQVCYVTATDSFNQVAETTIRFQSTVSISPGSVNITCSYVDGSCTAPTFSIQSSNPSSSFSIIGLICNEPTSAYTLNGNQIQFIELSAPIVTITFNPNGATSSFTGFQIPNAGSIFATLNISCNITITDQFGGLAPITLNFSESSATALTHRR